MSDVKEADFCLRQVGFEVPEGNVFSSFWKTEIGAWIDWPEPL